MTRLNLQSDGLTSESLNEDLHTSSQSQYKVEGRLLLDVVVRQSSAIFQLLSSKDQSLLIRWDTFFVLNLCLHILNGVRRFNLQSDGLASESLDEDLHTSSQSQNKVEGRLLLNVVIRQSSTILKL